MTVPTIFPARFKTRLAYSETVGTAADGTTSTTTGASVTFNLNSLFLPRSSGHQPYGFDTLATLYGAYVVTAAYIEVSCNLRTAENIGSAFAHVLLRASGGVDTLGALALAANKVAEKPLSKTFLLVGNGNRVGADFKMQVKLHALEGLTQAEYLGNSQYRALVSASPALMPGLQLANSSQGTVGQAVDWMVRIIYEVEFYDRTVLAQS